MNVGPGLAWREASAGRTEVRGGGGPGAGARLPLGRLSWGAGGGCLLGRRDRLGLCPHPPPLLRRRTRKRRPARWRQLRAGLEQAPAWAPPGRTRPPCPPPATVLPSSSRIGGEKVILLSASAWGFITAATPLLARLSSAHLVLMTFSRILTGLLQGRAVLAAPLCGPSRASARRARTRCVRV